MKNYFYFDESMTNPGKYLLRPNFNLLPLLGFDKQGGSYNILPARILNLSFASYLRLCRDRFSAEIVGKGERYCVPYFLKPNYELLKILNSRTETILKELD